VPYQGTHTIKSVIGSIYCRCIWFEEM